MLGGDEGDVEEGGLSVTPQMNLVMWRFEGKCRDLM